MIIWIKKELSGLVNLLDRKASSCHGDETADKYMSMKCPEGKLYIFERQNLGASHEVKS